MKRKSRSNNQCRLDSVPPTFAVYYLLVIIYVKDLPEVCNNLCKKFLFADDAKMYKCISNISDCEMLKNSGQHIYDWSEKWCMKLNVDKCKILSIKGRNEKIC